MTDAARSLLPSDWDAIAPLLDRLLDMPASERDAFYETLEALPRAELKRLMADCERALPLLERGALEVFDQLVGDEPSPSLPDVLGGRYRIERELGRGGMAIVYLAQDLKHARSVAVKVIRPELAASLGRERFLAEIGIAARLRHPNIMPLFDSGDADGVLYFVMPYEEGLSLRARLERDDPLSLSDAIGILRDVARALAYAHQQGVVHRDVKPDNVLLSANVAVVTDFGIAKAFSVAFSEAGTEIIAQSDAVIGTPAYMSPEQAVGDPATDHRADIYAFGCLAHEVLAGRHPFAEATTLETIGSRRTNATPNTDGVPVALARLMERCLEKDPALRPQRATELVDALGAVAIAGHAPLRKRRAAILVAPLLGVVIAAVLGAWYTNGRDRAVTLSVLPLLSVGGDSSQRLQAEGFSEDLATTLVRVPWLRIMNRQGAASYSGKQDIDPSAAGKKLGARYIVTGSLQHESDGTHTLTARLVRSEDSAVVWADRFAQPRDLAALRDRIVATICDSLRSTAGNVSGCAAGTRQVRHHANDDAYRLYLVGKREFNQRNQDLAGSVAHFRQAVALDTLFAEAWSGLSLALAVSPYYQGASPLAVAPEATANARRALRLDPTLAEPRIALAQLAGRRLEWVSSENEFKTALEIEPHSAEARLQYARLLIAQSRLPEAHEQLQRARQDEPASAVVLGLLSATWYLRGQLDSALLESDRGTESEPSNLTVVRFRSLILSALGRKDEARQVVAHLGPHIPLALYALAVAGDTTGARAGIRTLDIETPKGLVETARAFGFLGLGDTTRALDALERATDAREPWPFVASTSGPMFEAVQRSARFGRLLTRIGLGGK